MCTSTTGWRPVLPTKQLDPERELPGATGVIDLARFLQASPAPASTGQPPSSIQRGAQGPGAAERSACGCESLARVLAQAGLPA